MTDKNKSLNLLIEKERNEANEQLLIENKDLKQRISSLLAYISSLEYKLNNLYHKEEKEAKNTVKLSHNKSILSEIGELSVLNFGATVLYPTYNTKPFPEIMKNEGEENKNE